MSYGNPQYLHTLLTLIGFLPLGITSVFTHMFYFFD